MKSFCMNWSTIRERLRNSTTPSVGKNFSGIGLNEPDHAQSQRAQKSAGTSCSGLSFHETSLTGLHYPEKRAIMGDVKRRAACEKHLGRTVQGQHWIR